MLSGIALSFVEFLADKIFSKIIDEYAPAKIRQEQLRRELKSAIEESLSSAISSFPGSEYIFENFDANGFLNRPRVINELNLLFKAWGKPNEDILFEEWMLQSGIQNPGNLQLILKLFVLELPNKLRSIPEVREHFHYIESSEMHSVVGNIENKLSTMDTKVSSIAASISTSSGDKIDEREKEFETRIDTLLKLYKDGYPNACLHQLKEIEASTKGTQLSNRIRARIFSLMGGCLLALENQEEAVRLLERAYQLDQQNPDIVANYSLALLFKEDLDNAQKLAEDVLHEKPTHSLARIVQFEVWSRRKTIDDLDELINIDLLNDPAYTRTLGLYFLEEKDIEKSEKYLRLTIALEPNDIHALIALAGLLVEQKLHFQPLGNLSMLLPEHKEVIEEANRLIEAAYEKARNRDNSLLVNHILASRAGVRALGGDISGAKQDCDSVLQNNPSHVLALHNRALIAFQERELFQAINYFEKIPRDYLIKRHLILPLVISLIEENSFEKAIQLLDQIDSTKSEEYYDFLVMRAWIYIKKQRIEEALKIYSGLIENAQDEFRAHEAAGIIAKLSHDTENATLHFSHSFDLAGDSRDRNRIAITLGDLLFDNHNYDEAIIWYEKIDFDLLSTRSLASRYASAAYYSRDYGKAYDFVRKCYSLGHVYPELLEMHSWLAEYFGDLIEALHIQEKLQQIEPKKTKHIIELARLHYWMEERESAIATLQNIVYDEIDDPWELIKAAELYNLFEYADKALFLAYKARILGINIAEVQIAYLNIFLRSEEKVNLNFETVQVNTAIKLDNTLERRWLKIIDIVQPKEEDWEYSIDSYQGKILLDHKVGDQIDFREGSLKKLNFSIVEIQSVYVRAFQEIIEDFSARFPENLSLQRLQIVDGDFTNFFRFIVRSDIHIDQVENFFTKGAINLEQFSKLVGRDPLLTFISLQYKSEGRIFASLGTYEDQALQKICVNNANRITLGLTGLLTLKYLDMLEIITQRFEAIYVSQRLIDSIRKALLELDIEKMRGRKTIGYQNGQLFIHETPREVILNMISYLEELLIFLKNGCLVIPISSENAKHLISETSKDFVGEIGLSTVLVAKQTGTPIFTDDYQLRVFGLSQHSVHGFWTQELLLDTSEKGITQFDVYTNSCAKLALGNYFFLSINPEMIQKIMGEDLFSVSKRVDALLRTLKGPEILEDPAIGIAGKVLKNIWLERIPTDQRRIILDRILDYLTTERIRDRILRKLLLVMEAELLMAPLQEQEVKREIVTWARLHPLEGGISLGRRRTN